MPKMTIEFDNGLKVVEIPITKEDIINARRMFQKSYETMNIAKKNFNIVLEK